MTETNGHDIIVIGGSAGSIEALGRLVAQFEVDLPAAVFVVVHTSPDSEGYLAAILERAGSLPAHPAKNGEAIKPGRIYVAPPDQHLVLKARKMHLTRGPQENRTRPAVDPLFRTAAVAYRSRVIGIVLSGFLDDGTAGLDAIRRCGGLTVVQTPDDALTPDMPRNALANVDVDYCLPVAEMGAVLTRLTREPAPEADPVPHDLEVEATINLTSVASIETEGDLGELSPLTCPQCGGPMWEMDTPIRRYRCNVGHGYTARVLLAEQDQALEGALWESVRTLEQRAALLEKMARDEQTNHREASASRYAKRVAEAQAHIKVLRDLLLNDDE